MNITDVLLSSGYDSAVAVWSKGTGPHLRGIPSTQFLYTHFVSGFSKAGLLCGRDESKLCVGTQVALDS